MLYMQVWQGENIDWITVTPNNPDECDSEEFDEGQCTGFAVSNTKTEQFITDYLYVMNKYGIVINRC